MKDFTISSSSTLPEVSFFANCWVRDKFEADEINAQLNNRLLKLDRWLRDNPEIPMEYFAIGGGKFVYESKKKQISTAVILRYAERHHLPMPEIRKMIRSLERGFLELVWKME